MTEQASAEKNEITLGFIYISPIGGGSGTGCYAVQQLVDNIDATAIPLPNNVAESENPLRLPRKALIRGASVHQRLAFYHAYTQKSVASAQSVIHKKCAQQSYVTHFPHFMCGKCSICALQ